MTGRRSALRWLWRAGAAASPKDPGASGAGDRGGTSDAGLAGSQPPAGEHEQSDTKVAESSPGATVPRLLQQSAAWSWRLLIIGLIIYVAFRLADYLRLVTLPFIAALLFAALLEPLATWLRQRGVGTLLATWCCFLLALLIIGGAMTLVATQISADYPTLFNETQRTANEIAHSLAGPPFHLNKTRLSTLSSEALKYISQHKSVVAGTVLTTGKYALEFLTGVILTLFISFFLIKDGHRIWHFVIKGARGESHRRLDRAGHAAWRALVHYIRGTTVVAAIHALFIGLALWLLGVPLLVPFIVLIFIAAYVPLIGILVVGALAILVTLATKGWIAAVILLGVFILENQIEDHLLQPLVIGRIIRLHPLAIILALAVGGIVAGIPGAIIAVPVTAVITFAWPALRDGPPED